MKTLRHSIFLPIFALIALLGFGAGTVLADSNSEGVGGWDSKAVGAGQISMDLNGNPYGIDSTGDSRFTSDATGSSPKRRAFVGTLGLRGTGDSTGAGAATFEGEFSVMLQTSEEVEEVAISLPEGFEVSTEGLVESPIIRTPGGPRAGAFVDGARVVVLAEETEEGKVALWVLVKPVKPEHPVQGVVTAIDGDVVTVETPEGDTETLTLPEDSGDVVPGEVVTVFRGNSGHAKGLVRAQEVKSRLKHFLDDAEEDVDGAEEGGDEPEADDEERGKKQDKASAHAERIAKFLDRFSERQTQMLDLVMDRAPEHARAELEAIRERIQTQREEHQEAIARIRNKLDWAHPNNSDQGRPEAADDHRPDNSEQGRPENTDELRPEQAEKSRDVERPSSDDGRGRGR